MGRRLVALAVVIALCGVWWSLRATDTVEHVAPRTTNDGAATTVSDPMFAPAIAPELDSPAEVATERNAVGPAESDSPLVAEHHIVVRLVDPDGAPLRRVACTLTSWLERRSEKLQERAEHLTTDDYGRLRSRVHQPWSPGTWRFLVLSLGADARTAEATTSIDLSGPLAQPETDLGDWIVGAPRVLVAGRVLDDRGEPIQRARLVLERERSRFHTALPDPTLEATTNELGRFEIEERVHRVLLGDEERLTARAGAHQRAWSDPVACRAGERDVVIVLVGGGELRGAVAADPPWAASTMRVFAHRVDVDLGIGADVEGEVQTELEPPPFRFSRLPPGLYRIEVRTPLGEPLASVDRVLVRDGELATDPRLSPLIVPPRASALLRIVDAQGAEVRDARIARRVLGPDGTSRWLTLSWSRGECRVLAEPDSGPLIVRAPSKSSLRIEVTPGDHVATLEDDLHVRIKFARPATAAERARNVCLVLTSSAWDELGLTQSHTLEFGVDVITPLDLEVHARDERASGSEVELGARVGEAMSERYELAWTADGEDGVVRRWVDPACASVSIRDDDEAQRIVVPVPDDLLAKLARGEALAPPPPEEPLGATSTFPPTRPRLGKR